MGEGRSDYKNCVEGNHLVKNRTFVCYEKAVAYRDAKHLITQLLCIPVLLMFWTLTLRLGLLPRTPATLVTRPALPTEIMFLYLTWLLLKCAQKLSNALVEFSNALTKFGNALTEFSNALTDFSNALTDFSNAQTDFSNALTDFSNAAAMKIIP